jgi:hypothetical protein
MSRVSRKPRRFERPLRNLRWGVSGGLGIASRYTVWVVVLYLILGTDPFSRQGVRLPTVGGTYLVSGLVGGAVVGLLRPWADNGFGAFVVGLLAGVPITAGLMVCVAGWPSAWSNNDQRGFPVLAIMVGTALGYELNRRANGLIGVAVSATLVPTVRCLRRNPATILRE